MPENEVLRWYYDRLDIFATGEAAYANFEELYLTNGELYLGETQDTEWGAALFRITGPYPGGEVRY